MTFIDFGGQKLRSQLTYEHAHEKNSHMAFNLQWGYLLAYWYCLKGLQFYNILKIEYSCSVVALYYMRHYCTYLRILKLSDSKFCANLQMFNLTIREVFPPWGPGNKSRMCPPYPKRDRKRRLNGAVCRNHRIKGCSRVVARTGTLKNPTKCLWRWEPDRRSNFFFSPPAQLCSVTYMTAISLIVTFNNKFTHSLTHGPAHMWK